MVNIPASRARSHTSATGKMTAVGEVMWLRNISFVRSVTPRLAVVSVGRANHFGHPAPDVVQRYRDCGAEIFRTDQDGAVVIDTDGYSVNVRSFMGRVVELPRKHESTK